MSAPQLAYTVHAGNGPYLGLLHGFLSSGRQWTQNLEALSSVCTPVTIELWGHGSSPAPDEAHAYGRDGYVTALEEVRQALGAPQWFLCGYSIGAGITIRYAHEHPDRTIAHVFTNSASGFADEALIKTWQTDAEESAARIVERGADAIRRIPVHPRFARRLPEPVREMLMEDTARLKPTGIANTIRYTTPGVSVRDIAADNPRPALLCFGTHEKRFADARQWAEDNMADLSVVDLDAGHGVNMEDAAGFNAEVTSFIRRHSS